MLSIAVFGLEVRTVLGMPKAFSECSSFPHIVPACTKQSAQRDSMYLVLPLNFDRITDGGVQYLND